jgi:hypothetical protein
VQRGLGKLETYLLRDTADEGVKTIEDLSQSGASSQAVQIAGFAVLKDRLCDLSSAVPTFLDAADTARQAWATIASYHSDNYHLPLMGSNVTS